MSGGYDVSMDPAPGPAPGLSTEFIYQSLQRVQDPETRPSAAEPEPQVDDMTPDRAIEVVARRIAWLAVRNWPEWEQYPEIGETDWFAVLDHIDQMAPPLDGPDDEYSRAYALLTERAESIK